MGELRTLLRFRRFLIQPLCPFLYHRPEGFEKLAAQTSLRLFLAPRTQILFSVLPDLRLETLSLYGMFECQVVMLTNKRENKSGEIAFERALRHPLFRESLGRLQQSAHRHLDPGLLISLLRMVEPGKVALDRHIHVLEARVVYKIHKLQLL